MASDIGADARRPAVARRDERTSDISARLDDLARLEEDWDSYGGMPPTAAAVAAARLLLARIGDRSTAPSPDAWMPFPNGGIQVIWERDADELQIDVGPAGEYGYLRVGRDGDYRQATEADGVSMNEILTLVDQFLR